MENLMVVFDLAEIVETRAAKGFRSLSLEIGGCRRQSNQKDRMTIFRKSGGKKAFGFRFF